VVALKETSDREFGGLRAAGEQGKRQADDHHCDEAARRRRLCRHGGKRKNRKVCRSVDNFQRKKNTASCGAIGVAGRKDGESETRASTSTVCCCFYWRFRQTWFSAALKWKPSTIPFVRPAGELLLFGNRRRPRIRRGPPKAVGGQGLLDASRQEQRLSYIRPLSHCDELVTAHASDHAAHNPVERRLRLTRGEKQGRGRGRWLMLLLPLQQRQRCWNWRRRR